MKPKLTPYLIDLAIKKARQSSCTYKVSALGFNTKGDYIGAICNKKSSTKHSEVGKNGLHAEIELFKRYHPASIIIFRSNKSGKLLPIHPCKRCQAILKNHNVQITTIEDLI